MSEQEAADPPTMAMARRTFLTGAAGAATLAATGAATGASAQPAQPGQPAPAAIPIIDTHIHLFDPRRPQGAPYRGPKGFPTYTEGALPEGYAGLVAPYHVVGAIEVEASPWIEDNLWVLETAARHDIMVGTIGNIPLDAPDFAAMIDRYRKNRLFLGVRYGNLWRYDLAGRFREPAIMAGLRHLADAGLVLDTANPRLDLLEAVLRVSDAVPTLRIVVDHLPHYDPAAGEVRAYETLLHAFEDRPDIYVKLSEIIHPQDGRTSALLADHRTRLDQLTGTFGEDRVLFGSDWPNILQDATLDQVFDLARSYYADKPAIAQEKFFWRNSISAYRWQPRSLAQRNLLS